MTWNLFLAGCQSRFAISGQAFLFLCQRQFHPEFHLLHILCCSEVMKSGSSVICSPNVLALREDENWLPLSACQMSCLWLLSPVPCRYSSLCPCNQCPTVSRGASFHGPSLRQCKWRLARMNTPPLLALPLSERSKGRGLPAPPTQSSPDPPSRLAPATPGRRDPIKGVWSFVGVLKIWRCGGGTRCRKKKKSVF